MNGIMKYTRLIFDMFIIRDHDRVGKDGSGGGGKEARVFLH